MRELSKAVFVMDMPENGCMDCKVYKETLIKSFCGITGKDVYGNHERGGFPEDCPLKSMPDKRCSQNVTSDYDKSHAFVYVSGWNDCIDEICKNEK